MEKTMLAQVGLRLVAMNLFSKVKVAKTVLRGDGVKLSAVTSTMDVLEYGHVGALARSAAVTVETSEDAGNQRGFSRCEVPGDLVLKEFEPEAK